MITIFLKTANILKNSPATNADVFPWFLSIVLEAIFWRFFSNSYRVYTSNIGKIFRSSHIFSYQTLISKASEITPKKQLMSRWVVLFLLLFNTSVLFQIDLTWIWPNAGSTVLATMNGRSKKERKLTIN